MADSGLIDRALVSVLASDATLMALVPDGVFFDQAPANAARFVIVSLLAEIDVQQFRGRAFEEATYLVEARMLSTAGGDVQAAAARIDVLLEGATLTATGYTTVLVTREERLRRTEADEIEPTIRWFRRGGRYRVVMAAT